MSFGRAIIGGHEYDVVISGKRYNPIIQSGIRFVDYIESSGTQYIDTGFKPNANTRVIVDLEVTKTPTTPVGVYGARTAYNVKNYSLTITANATFRSDYNTFINQNFSASALGRHTVDKNKNKTTVEGESKSYNAASFQCDYNLVIFAWNESNKKTNFSSIKLYSFKLYDNGTLIMDLVPCKDSNGVYGLYDKISGTVYYNSGSGEFTGG